MKKLLAITLTVLMMFSLVSVAAFADVFIESPSKDNGPELVSSTSSNPDWKGNVKVTPYKDRDQLPEELQNEMADAVEALLNSTELGLNLDEHAVSSIFDVYTTESGYGTLTLSLKSDKFKGFVELLHFTGTSWEKIDGASVDENNVLTFSCDNFSPFAVVVLKNGGTVTPGGETPGNDTPGGTTPGDNVPDAPATGTSFPWFLMAGAVLFGAAGASLLTVGCRKKTGE